MATVNDLYKRTKAIMFEKPSSTIYDNYLVENLNRLLVELFHENNMARLFNGETTIYASPQVIPSTSYSDVELLYEDDIVNNVLPLGLAARFLIDDDLNKYSIYNTDYNNARVLNQKMVSKEKIDAATIITDI